MLNKILRFLRPGRTPLDVLKPEYLVRLWDKDFNLLATLDGQPAHASIDFGGQRYSFKLDFVSHQPPPPWIHPIDVVAG